MSESYTIFQNGLLLVVWLSLPTLLTAVFFGILISLVQTALSVQDQALPFAFKLIAVGVVLALTGRWMSSEVLQLADAAMQAILKINHAGRTSL
jgi:type III secretion protein S